ncbi:efflux RND transporter periplasmic adaptor subunit [Rubritalea spongiae]
MIKFILVLLVLGIGVAVMKGLMSTSVKAPAEGKELFVPNVEVLEVVEENYKVVLRAQGKVEPVSSTEIVSEVSGAIDWVSPELKAGGKFKKGELMLKLSQADYLSQLEQARANVADAELQIVQEEARAEQGLRDWKKLGRGGEPGELIKRVPQLKSAKARLIAAEAAVKQAERDLAKTEIVAPYACLVESAQVDQGGYLTSAGRVAIIYEADKVQVRLPLSLEDVSYLPPSLENVAVEINAQIGRLNEQWIGKVVRTEGVIDRATHTMMTVVEVAEKKDDGRFPLPPFGLFVEGVFKGTQFENVVRLPRMALRTNGTVWLVDSKGLLEVRDVTVERSDRDTVMVVDGLSSGESVITSPIEIPVDGMKVEISKTANRAP